MSTTLNVIRGDTNSFSLTLTGLPDGGLAGADITFTVAGLLEKTLGDGIDVTDAEAGTAVITIDAGDTDAAPDGHHVYAYDVQVTFADATVQTPIRGLFVTVPDVTVESA